MSFRIFIKYWLFPGINLHSRLRYKELPKHFGSSSDKQCLFVLDAGSGNGMLAYQNVLMGNKVVGVSFKPAEVLACREMFNRYLGISEKLLRFHEGNLYDLRFESETFDEIICSEVLEHLRRDSDVCQSFWRLLKPGGVLHLCAPNAAHPYNKNFPLDLNENGGHVRPGYTLESYHALLEPLGFQITESEGLGGPVRQFFNRLIKMIQGRFGAFAGLPLFVVALLALPFEQRHREQDMPYSLYVRARKLE